MVEAPSPPYIPAEHQGGHQAVIKRIVLHSTVSDTYCGGARAIASYFQNPTYVSSAHYAVDPCEVIQMVYDNTVAWHDGTNNNSIGIEMCEHPSQDIGRWSSDEHQDMLERTADLTRQLCLAYGVPLRRINADQIRAGEEGICGHDDMSAAYPENSSHWDPGAFPWDQFMNLVRDGAPEEEDDMPSAEDVWRHKVWGGPEKSNVPAGDRLAWIDGLVNDNTQMLRELKASVSGLSAAVAALSDDSGLSAERVEQIVRDAVKQNIEISGDVQISGSEEQQS